MTDIDTLRHLALALLIAEARPLAVLDDEVRAALGMRARRGRLRLDDLSLRLVQLIGSSDLWRVRAQRARRALMVRGASAASQAAKVRGLRCGT
ncbi:hypothetical protein [Niveispirillum fermenti]|uniref:hypothetical protein n=1 Tax=Niveispirillum fermenti TaxID=1233113 RepID=UPI003A891702